MPDTASYAAAATYLRGRFRELSGPDDPSFARFTGADEGIGAEEFLSASPFPEAVSKFLLQLDAKLDALLAHARADTLQEDFPHPLEVYSLSAATVHFSSPLPLAVGDWLEIVLELPQTGIVTAAGIGHILAKEGQKNGLPLFTFAFTRITEEEREKIFRFVFKEERRNLRLSRLE